ncbi:hypothetical protein Raf01_63440 [Rugosimonospora africana]|uniref:Uncharacterized protein n=1 Tax=Rugosimonospora africana TaxID=556532 RepID=A0A8J3QXX7_9ACTN|nr:hypothetical protein Raf01_63440 [Rugosimonospora africana]
MVRSGAVALSYQTYATSEPLAHNAASTPASTAKMSRQFLLRRGLRPPDGDNGPIGGRGPGGDEPGGTPGTGHPGAG